MLALPDRGAPPKAAALAGGDAGAMPNSAGSTSKGSIRIGTALLCAKAGALLSKATPPTPSVANQTASGKRMALGTNAPLVTDLRDESDKREGTAMDNDQFQIAHEKRPVSAVCPHKVKYSQF